MTITVDARKVFRWHLALIALMGALFGIVVIADMLGRHNLFGFARLFRLTVEANIPTTFSSLALAAAALAAFAITRSAGIDARERHRWTIFSGVFLFLAIDELWQLHELLNPVGRAMHLPAAFHYFGAFPYLLFSAVLGFYMLPFWMRQSRPVMTGLAVGGICYVLAAVGMEIPENLLIAGGAERTDLPMAICYAIEELGEMIAVALFLRAFLTRLEELPSAAMISLAVRGSATAAEPVPIRRNAARPARQAKVAAAR